MIIIECQYLGITVHNLVFCYCTEVFERTLVTCTTVHLMHTEGHFVNYHPDGLAVCTTSSARGARWLESSRWELT